MSFERKFYKLVWPEGSRWSGLEVVMKGLSSKNLMAVSSLKGASEESLDPDLVGEILEIVSKRMIRWNLTADGEPVPTDTDSLADEDFGMIMDIVRVWTDSVVGVSKSLGKGSSSGSTFPEESIPMETL